MTTWRIVPAGAALAALVAMLGVAPFCPPAEAMPCCAKASHCDAGMRAAGCCRVEPSPTTPHAPAAQRPTPGPSPRVAALVADLSSAVAAIPVGKASFTPILPHRDPVPLYLLDASILR